MSQIRRPAAAPAEATTFVQRWCTPVRLNVLVTVAFGALLGLWAIAVPLFEAPDERAHVDMIAQRAVRTGWPPYDEMRISKATQQECVKRAADVWGCLNTGPRGRVTHDADQATDKADNPTYAERQVGPELFGTKNQMTQHPPLYYDIAAKVLQVSRTVFGDRLSFAQEISLLRFISVLMISPVPFLVWLTARRLGLGQVTAFAASLLPFAIPQFTHIGSTVSNDALLTLLGTVTIALGAGVVHGDRSWRTAVGLGVACGGALLTKSSAFVFPFFVAAAYAVGWWRTGRVRGEVPAALGRLGVAGALTSAMSGWWYLRNKVRHDTFVPSIHTDGLASLPKPPGFDPSPRIFGEWVVDQWPSRFWGYFGTFSLRMSWPLILGSSAVAVALAVIGMAAERPSDDAGADGSGGRRLALATVSLPAVALGLFVIQHSWDLFSTTGYKMFLQGRYVFPGLAGPLVAMAAGARRIAGRYAPVLLGGWGAVMQLDALLRVMSGYWGGADLVGQVRSMVAWSPWSGEVVAIALALCTLPVVALATVVGAGTWTDALAEADAG